MCGIVGGQLEVNSLTNNDELDSKAAVIGREPEVNDAARYRLEDCEKYAVMADM